MAGQSVGNDRTIGQLVADATHDVQGIVRSEIALAKAEVTTGAKVMGKGAGLLAGAGVLAVFGALQRPADGDERAVRRHVAREGDDRRRVEA